MAILAILFNTDIFRGDATAIILLYYFNINFLTGYIPPLHRTTNLEKGSLVVVIYELVYYYYTILGEGLRAVLTILEGLKESGSC